MKTRHSHRKGGGNSNKQETTEVSIVLCKLFNLSTVVCKLSSNITHVDGERGGAVVVMY